MTAVKPTTMETRAPKIRRDSTSRPTWSVPSRWASLPPACHAGGRKRSPSTPISGLYGASTSAKIAASAIMPMMIVGIQGKPSMRSQGKRQGTVTEAARLPFIATYLS